MLRPQKITNIAFSSAFSSFICEQGENTFEIFRINNLMYLPHIKYAVSNSHAKQFRLPQNSV